MPTVAVIDDDIDIVEATTLLLESNGYDVCSAQSADDGLDLVHREQPDVLLLDIMLDEGNDGLFLAQQINRGGWTMPIILVSSLPPAIGEEFSVRTDVPIQAFLEKPVPSGTLLNTVRLALLRGKTQG
jgi:DNA-binding response OmpR family regulator